MNITKQRLAVFAAVGGIMVGGSALADTVDTSGTTTSAFATGGDLVYRVWKADGGVDFVHVFTNTSAAAAFTNTSGKDLAVRYLAVGGGGAGATANYSKSSFAGGGGGGGGGVAEANATLSAEDAWSIRVGVGGKAADGIRGSIGDAGATAVSNGTEEVVLVPGGGHGAQYCNTYDEVYYELVAQPGAAGGGGGGYITTADRYGTNGTFQSYTLSGMSGGPFKGGDCNKVYTNSTATGTTKWFLSGGGGGAGGVGETPTSNYKKPELRLVSGAGGAGLACDITGAPVYYGAGGGGGGLYFPTYLSVSDGIVYGGAGGSEGVGGAGGTVAVDGETKTYVAAQSGLAGTGTGGGGGVTGSGATKTGGNGGSGVVVVRYTAVSSWNGDENTPDFEIVGAPADQVTLKMSGETVTDEDGKLWVKPGTTATLYAEVKSDGYVVTGWEDGETGELIRSDLVQVTPATRRSYAAVFGKPWTYNTTTMKLTNGDWEFDVGVVSKKKLCVTNCTQAAADTVLNLATPMTDETGAAFKPSAFGSGVQKKVSFIPKTLCTNVRVFLPEGVNVGEHCFRGAWGNATLRGSISVPRNITFGPGGVAYGSTALTNVYFEGGADGGQTVLGNGVYGCFMGCTHLKHFGPLPSTCKIVSSCGFSCCSSLEALELPSVTMFGYDALDNCSSLTQVVFSANTVSLDANTYTNGFASGVPVSCRWLFPSNAPNLVCKGTATVDGVEYPYTGMTNGSFFGSTDGVKLYGSWRTDPEGWKKIRAEIGSADMTGLTLPTLDRTKGERAVKGIFRWAVAGKNGYKTKPHYGWLIDVKMPNEPPPPGLIMLMK